MYAPDCPGFPSYGVALDPASAVDCAIIAQWPALANWIEAAKSEPEELEELDAEF